MTMQTTKQGSKNGGPYTKKEQEERRKQVYHLYYEKNYPIVKIANTLNVNRNTISEDVKHWYSQFAEELEHVDLSTWMTSHILKLESQKMRLLEEVEKTDHIQTKLGLEKMIFLIESKLGQVGLELIKNKKISYVPENPEKEIEEIVKHLINLKIKQDCFFSRSEIEYEILKFKKCTEFDVSRYSMQMNHLGINYCSIISEDVDEYDDEYEEVFDIKKFAELRGYSI